VSALRGLWNLGIAAQAFADAAVDPSLWNKAMDTIAMETGSSGAILLPVRGTIPNVPSTESIMGSTEVYFRDQWYTRDVRFRSLQTMMRDGVVDDFDFITADEMKTHPYYQEFLRPFGLQYFGGVKIAADDDIFCLSIQRSSSSGPFSSTETRQLADFSRRASATAALARALGFASADAAAEAFELSDSAVVTLDRRGEVLRLNGAAEKLLGPNLFVAGRRLTSQDREATAALDRVLREVLWSDAASALMPPVALPRRSGRPLLAYAVKLSTVSRSIFADCQAILVLVDFEKRVRLPQDALQSAFALTAAEARLALHVAAGDTLERAADQLRISKETARNQLKAVFRKTAAHRQSELVMLLSKLLHWQK
jgi:DNA-binding CsgD family transcriptional regulator/PAS domain-containing protein